METFYVIRYTEHVPVDHRKHAHTLGRFDSWVSADDARVSSPVAELLEVVGPRTDAL